MTCTPKLPKFEKNIKEDSIDGEPYQCLTRPDNEDESLLQVYDYWKDKCNQYNRTPKLREIELMDLWKVADKLILLDHIISSETPNRFFFRYFGSAVARFSRMDFTGHYLDQVVTDETLPETIDTYLTVLQTGVPNIWKRKLEFDDNKPHIYCFTRLILPLLNDNNEPAHLLGVLHMY